MSEVTAVVGHVETVAAGAAGQHGYVVIRSTTKPLRVRQLSGSTTGRYAIVDLLLPKDFAPVTSLAQVQPGWSRSNFDGVTTEIFSGLVTAGAIPQDWPQTAAAAYLGPAELFVPAGSFLVAINESAATQFGLNLVYDELGG